jgi:hypothetical protein
MGGKKRPTKLPKARIPSDPDAQPIGKELTPAERFGREAKDGKDIRTGQGRTKGGKFGPIGSAIDTPGGSHQDQVGDWLRQKYGKENVFDEFYLKASQDNGKLHTGRTRVDYVVIDKNGDVLYFDAKPTSGREQPMQKKHWPDLKTNGGEARSRKWAHRFRYGSRMPSGKVVPIRKWHPEFLKWNRARRIAGTRGIDLNPQKGKTAADELPSRKQPLPRARVRKGGKIAGVIEEVGDLTRGIKTSGKAGARLAIRGVLQTARAVRFGLHLAKNILLPPFTPLGIASEVLLWIIFYALEKYQEIKIKREEYERIHRLAAEQVRSDAQNYIDKNGAYLSNLYRRNWRRPNKHLLYVQSDVEVVRTTKTVKEKGYEVHVGASIGGFIKPYKVPPRIRKVPNWTAKIRKGARPVFRRDWLDPSKIITYERKNGDKGFRFTYQFPLPIITPFDYLLSQLDDLSELISLYKQTTAQYGDEVKAILKRLSQWKRWLMSHRYESDANIRQAVEGGYSVAAHGRRHRENLIHRFQPNFENHRE